MNAKISVSVICVEAIIYLLLYNLHDSTFKVESKLSNDDSWSLRINLSDLSRILLILL